MTQIPLSKEENKLLSEIKERGERRIQDDERKGIAHKLEGLGLISIEKKPKQWWLYLTDHGKEYLQSEGITPQPPIDLSSIVQKLDDLKKTLQSYIDQRLNKQYEILLRMEKSEREGTDELKHYIDQRLNKQYEILLRMVKPEREGTIDEDTFLKVTREEYVNLAQTSPISPYVAIKLLRDFVCKRLNLGRTTFDTMLLSLANKDPYTVQLSTSSGERGTGIIYGRGECHAAIIK